MMLDRDLILNGIHAVNGRVSLVVKDVRKNAILFSYGGNDLHSSASTIKVPIMMAILKMCQESELSLADSFEIADSNRVGHSITQFIPKASFSVNELLFWMITLSDNTATNVLIDIAGLNSINRFMRDDLGLSKTVLQRKMFDFEAREKGQDNFTTASELTTVLDKLYNHEGLNSEYTDIALSYMKKQRFREFITHFISEDVQAATKSGQLNGIRHDMGIVFLQNIDYSVSALVSDSGDTEMVRMQMSKICFLIYESLKRR